MSQLFNDFETVSSAQWKQKIQYELKGADYNQTLVWESLEGIKVKPFYHVDEPITPCPIPLPQNGFQIIEHVFIDDIRIAKTLITDRVQRGAHGVILEIPSADVQLSILFEGLPNDAKYFIKTSFLRIDWFEEAVAFVNASPYDTEIWLDPIGTFETDGNWFTNTTDDFKIISEIFEKCSKAVLTIDGSIFLEAGGNKIQQVAYTSAKLNEYLNRLTMLPNQIRIVFAAGSDYFLEIAKIRALRWLVNSLLEAHEVKAELKILVTPAKRNKTIYDYNVNMLRTTMEYMSGILGGADEIMPLAYDAIYHKDNEFGNRIARNQLLILKHESYFDEVSNAVDGAYFIEDVTKQIAENALALLKEMDANGGWITQLMEGTPQRKIRESEVKEQEWFDAGKIVRLGTNKYPNPQDRMKNDLELYPFVKKRAKKTLIARFIPKRLTEKVELERLEKE